ncbi:hypothetical protein SAMD00019534_048870 [Acytostelium subglobosum LB1]|uniref:hypothetical protein n=1 Tax=Acytostelium subglobosum LB1 TaxID=1410327 RepID=UPI000645239A|nr:hypothetical protein SAMD00019534_048870 [Acytostelium subglobosum LB1]GAM21712.1 hypothetical protein SAMD00019534_048870 [Acytostelium subglobosum LB1]|eukprot:XP_012755831.1 hypothetical protein SAMD00019534_048870 [Acytostelium subglobosum LB1]
MSSDDVIVQTNSASIIEKEKSPKRATFSISVDNDDNDEHNNYSNDYVDDDDDNDDDQSSEDTTSNASDSVTTPTKSTGGVNNDICINSSVQLSVENGTTAEYGSPKTNGGGITRSSPLDRKKQLQQTSNITQESIRSSIPDDIWCKIQQWTVKFAFITKGAKLISTSKQHKFKSPVTITEALAFLDGVFSDLDLLDSDDDE